MIGKEKNQNELNEINTGLTQPLQAPLVNSNVPNIAMSESYNAASSKPVFSPATQEKALNMFGSNDQRQISVNGVKDSVKEEIISKLSSL